MLNAKATLIKGSDRLELTKGTLVRIIRVDELGADYSYQVRVVFRVLTGFKAGKVYSLVSRHRNRLSDPLVRLHNGDPTNFIVIKIQKDTKAPSEPPSEAPNGT